MAESWHFIGIGGSGMSVLAHALLDKGDRVSGSDLGESAAVEALRARGASVAIGHSADNPDLPETGTVVISSAVPNSNPELIKARNLGKKVIKRAELLGRLMDERNGVAIAGTAGKTTTTAMLAWILKEAQRDPAFMVGGVLVNLGTGGYWGAGPELVAEADEYDGSFWQLRPEVAVVTNVEAEHLDIYGDLQGVRDAFLRFASNVRGAIYCCADDEGALWLAEELRSRGATPVVRLYGTRAGDWQAIDLALNDRGGSDFRVVQDGEQVATVQLHLPGKHNVLNALAAFAVAGYLGVSSQQIADSLSSFSGTHRRFQHKGLADDVIVIDDYAHHPTKIAATMEAARRHLLSPRLVVIFQPHTYSRTRDFLPEFVKALSPADTVIVTPIYASRETDTLGLTGHEIPDLLNEQSPGKATYAADLHEAAQKAVNLLLPGDALITMGAGDVWKAGDEVLKLLQARALQR